MSVADHLVHTCGPSGAVMMIGIGKTIYMHMYNFTEITPVKFLAETCDPVEKQPDQ